MGHTHALHCMLCGPECIPSGTCDAIFISYMASFKAHGIESGLPGTHLGFILKYIFFREP